MTSTTLRPAEVFPPGEYLKDELDERGWTVTEFAEIIGRPIQAVSEIINGKKEITTETAIAFAQALGTSPELWLNLQTNFRLFEHRRSSASGSSSKIQRRAQFRKVIPLSEVKRIIVFSYRPVRFRAATMRPMCSSVCVSMPAKTSICRE